jgi:hypothetical protein
MGSINKSVKWLIYRLLKEKGELSLKEIIKYIQLERDGVHVAHIRGVLNSDIKKGSKFFSRVKRGFYTIKEYKITEYDLVG